jgi:hypothetical protein
MTCRTNQHDYDERVRSTVLGERSAQSGKNDESRGGMRLADWNRECETRSEAEGEVCFLLCMYRPGVGLQASSGSSWDSACGCWRNGALGGWIDHRLVAALTQQSQGPVRVTKREPDRDGMPRAVLGGVHGCSTGYGWGWAELTRQTAGFKLDSGYEYIGPHVPRK